MIKFIQLFILGNKLIYSLSIIKLYLILLFLNDVNFIQRNIILNIICINYVLKGHF